jgi:hypothetical protein
MTIYNNSISIRPGAAKVVTPAAQAAREAAADEPSDTLSSPLSSFGSSVECQHAEL